MLPRTIDDVDNVDNDVDKKVNGTCSYLVFSLYSKLITKKYKNTNSKWKEGEQNWNYHQKPR